ncbi:hypothetical protein HYPSUDRAFT_201863 [Hypholoma sublateritium FD-334 SS-4]|uniref:Uncharacterized protein n=1 Tax=Hypholoma sublateritium (strain FD-334 SS-4) TaxID=945553 RepID=A0A0D2P245_HYPSF|nr:hypothetical protein HYPSUDRAFT_201863 [Hypholoma sublateritium FD-334 SS-4]
MQEAGGGERRADGNLQSSTGNTGNNREQNLSQANGARLAGVDVISAMNDLAHDERPPAPPQYAAGSEPDEWESGLRASYASLTSNLQSIQLEIPGHTLTHTEASGLVGQAYEIEQHARILHTWAHRQLSNATKNVAFSERRLAAAEAQVRKIVELIERNRYWRVVQEEPAGVPIMPYVIEQDEEVCALSMNGCDPISVLIAPNPRRVG